jgi:hypothetical protein
MPNQDHTEDFSRLQQQYSEIFSPASKPAHLAVDTRKFAEAICRRLFAQEMGKEPEKLLTLEEYFRIFRERKLPIEYIYPHIETLQKLGNYAGHDQRSQEPITVGYIQPALSAVDFLMNWYVHTRLQQPHLQFVKGQVTNQTPLDSKLTESNNYELEMVSGAIPLNSKFYVTRTVDEQFMEALQRRHSIVLLKGPRQVGKTSLLARGIQRAREAGIQVVLTDCQKLPAAQMRNLEDFLLMVSTLLAKQLKLPMSPKSVWDSDCMPTLNFETYFMEHILTSTKQPVLWAIDEADYLFHHPFSSEVFSLLRSWHNERALNPITPCHRLTIAIAYATESYLFIKDQNQSPFNVGTKLVLADFTLEQLADLNGRYGTPLRTSAELQEFFNLVGGHPYLVRAGLNDLVSRSLSVSQLRQQATLDEGVYGDHLRRIVMLLHRDPQLSEIIRNLFRGKPCPDYDSFYRLRSAGILRGESKDQPQFRCQVYADYLKQHLLS